MNPSKELVRRMFFHPGETSDPTCVLPSRSPQAATPANAALHPRIWVVPNDPDALLVGKGAEAMRPWKPAHGVAGGREPTME